MIEFKRKKIDSLENPGQVLVEYREEREGTPGDFCILASSVGVQFKGKSSFPLASNVDLQNFAKAVGDAGHDFVNLKNALKKKLVN